MPKRTLIGKVTSDKMAKTRVVHVPRLVRHPMYGKLLRKRTICYVHDENNESQMGDTVEIEESPPMSRNKRWKLVQVLEKRSEVDLAEIKAAHHEAEQPAGEA